jgi:hypothetical protein
MWTSNIKIISKYLVLFQCQEYNDCCRYLICSGYAAKCVPKGGLVVPGVDKRPLGPGPYPPNVPKSELP